MATGQWVVLRVGYAFRGEAITRSVWLPANERTRRLNGRYEVTLAIDALVPSRVVIADLHSR